MKVDWAEYGRVEKGELSVSMTLSGVTATVTFENKSPRLLHVYTAFLESRFQVFLDDQKLEYLGPEVCVSPSKQWYSDIPPGKKSERTVDLSSAYGISRKSRGELRVRFTFDDREPFVEREISLKE